jgi:hypothetical protein
VTHGLTQKKDDLARFWKTTVREEISWQKIKKDRLCGKKGETEDF